MERILKNGLGWRLGWNPQGTDYHGLVGTDDWAIELTNEELDDFCRLLIHLAQTMRDIAGELMDEEKISCEAESDSIWLEVEGYPHAYTLRFILNRGRRCEGNWQTEALPGLVQAAKSLKVF